MHVLGHHAAGVFLDEQVDVPRSVLVGNGSVRADGRLLHLRALVLGDERAGDVEAGDGILLVQLEAELLSVVVDVLNRLERELDETLVASGEALDGAVASLSRNVLLLCAGGRRIGLRCASSGVPVTSSERGDTGGAIDQATVASGLGCLRSIVADLL